MNNDRADDTANPKADAEEIENSRLMPQLRMMASALWAARAYAIILFLQ